MEEIGPSYLQVELDDGFHPLTPGCVFRDSEHTNDAIMFVCQDDTAPEGDEHAARVVYRTDQLKLQQKTGKWGGPNIRVCGMFWRRLESRFWDFLYALTCFVIISAGYFLLWLFLWAAYHIWIPFPPFSPPGGA